MPSLKKSRKLNKPKAYESFAGFVNGIRRLDVTFSHWDELSSEEQEIVTELSGQISNAIGELKQVNPNRWGTPHPESITS